MAGPLAVSPQRLRGMNETASLERAFNGAEIIAVSGLLQKDLDAPRFKAVLRTVDASQKSGVPHLIMLDDRSHEGTGDYLARRGATVVTIDGETEGGLASPYVIAAQLIEEFTHESAVMVKFEGEKSVFTGGRNISEIQEGVHQFDVISGVRTLETWASMPPFQVQTEFWLGSAIGEMLGVSQDTPSGVIALTSAGRKYFINSVVDNHWSYLFGVPLMARKSGLRCGSFDVDFRYDSSVVAEETGNRVFDQKRLVQIDEMLDKAFELFDGSSRATQALRLIDFRRVMQRMYRT